MLPVNFKEGRGDVPFGVTSPIPGLGFPPAPDVVPTTIVRSATRLTTIARDRGLDRRRELVVENAACLPRSVAMAAAVVVVHLGAGGGGGGR